MRFIHDDDRGDERLRDVECGLLHVVQIRMTVVAHRRADRDEDHRGVAQRRTNRRPECQSARMNVAVYEFFESRLEERYHTSPESLDFRCVAVDADDGIAEFGKTRTGHEADVPAPTMLI